MLHRWVYFCSWYANTNHCQFLVSTDYVKGRRKMYFQNILNWILFPVASIKLHVAFIWHKAVECWGHKWVVLHLCSPIRSQTHHYICTIQTLPAAHWPPVVLPRYCCTVFSVPAIWQQQTVGVKLCVLVGGAILRQVECHWVTGGYCQQQSDRA